MTYRMSLDRILVIWYDWVWEKGDHGLQVRLFCSFTCEDLEPGLWWLLKKGDNITLLII